MLGEVRIKECPAGAINTIYVIKSPRSKHIMKKVNLYKCVFRKVEKGGANRKTKHLIQYPLNPL